MTEKTKAVATAVRTHPGFSDLSPRQQAFILHPDILKDPVKAAMEAGYSESNSLAHAHEMRRRLMKFLTPMLEDRLAVLSVTAGKIRDELAVTAFAKITDFFEYVDIKDKKGVRTVMVFRDPKLLPEHMQRAIKRVTLSNEVDEDGNHYQTVTDIELHDKDRAISLLSEVMGLKDKTRRLDDDTLNEDEVLMLESLEDDELELVQRLYKKAQARIEELRNNRAIPGTATSTTTTVAPRKVKNAKT